MRSIMGLSARSTLAFLAGSVVVAACTQMERGADADATAASFPASTTAVPLKDYREERAAADSSAPSSTSAQQNPLNMIIRNGSVSVQVDSLESAMAAARQIASNFGGMVGNVSVSAGEMQVRSATLQLRIPSDRFDDALVAMGTLGKVEHSNSTAQDVGEEYVDLTARITNNKRVETRLVNLLATRAGTLEDVLAVERELARVRQDIERIEGRMRFLGSRVATSTIEVSVHERLPLISQQPGTNVMVQAFANSWRNFVMFIAALIEGLGVLLPIGVAAWLIYRWARRMKVAPRAQSQGT